MENPHIELCASKAQTVTVRSARPREYLTEREIEKLMDAASGNRWGHRDATAIRRAYRHGPRASELWRLRGTTSTSRLQASCAACQGGDASVHPIGGKELRALRRLQREAPEGARTGYVFGVRAVWRRSASLAITMVAGAGEAAGFPFLIDSHMDRHSSGYKLANDGPTPVRSNMIRASVDRLDGLYTALGLDRSGFLEGLISAGAVRRVHIGTAVADKFITLLSSRKRSWTIPQPCCSGRCWPPVRSTCAKLTAGKRSPPSPSISRLTSPLDRVQIQDHLEIAQR